LLAHFILERRTASAAIDVSPQLAARRHVARSRERLADLRARSVSGPATAPQGLAGLEDERFDLFAANAEHRADLGVRVVT
jgi:hypothetical protein